MVTRDLQAEILWRRWREVNALSSALLLAMMVSVVHAQDGTQPIARGDENSRIAHAQLVEKARRGGIDVYFAGDSITRRWGTSDAAYREFLDNWTRNFFGWNAANFGWGGDTSQNILWRLIEGELDGVHPKVIVLMGGTNNVGGAPRQGIDAGVVENVVSGTTADPRRDAAEGAGRDSDSDGHHPAHGQQRGSERDADHRHDQRSPRAAR